MALKYLLLHVIFGSPICKRARILKPKISLAISKVNCFILHDAIHQFNYVVKEKQNILPEGFL